jgi:hypothetical protein
VPEPLELAPKRKQPPSRAARFASRLALLLSVAKSPAASAGVQKR